MNDDYRIRRDLKRQTLGQFQLPLGFGPCRLDPPQSGYVLGFHERGKDDDDDTYVFEVAVSHERLADLVCRCFYELLPESIYAIVELGSRDAYRAVDVYLSTDPISREFFIEGWRAFEPILLEDCAIAAGANSDDPSVEVFVDQWKQLVIHVPPQWREKVEALLQRYGLSEVEKTWPFDDPMMLMDKIELRPVLDDSDEESADFDALLHELRYLWLLELDVDPDTNTDEAGRPLGYTLWRALITIEDEKNEPGNESILSIWITAKSFGEARQLIEELILQQRYWRLHDILMLDRVAYDERPDDLNDIAPRRTSPEVHMVTQGPWYPADSPPNLPREGRSNPPNGAG